MKQITQQPVTVMQSIMQSNGGLSVKLLMLMFARLVHILVSRGFLHAGEVLFITSGYYFPDEEYADWTPADELDQGPEIPIIRTR